MVRSPIAHEMPILLDLPVFWVVIGTSDSITAGGEDLLGGRGGEMTDEGGIALMDVVVVVMDVVNVAKPGPAGEFPAQ